ncbi:Cell division GTPase [Rubellimicrobium thermophilum DSM 16684]|uniref:Cell division GTPase n=1 Tax=Rubellimicrobium thermophilum DSM 16684 TaxID=1123069 RepID=S9R0L2_9RHOB|nr:Cell division GTPase [Rubellimicrobium thermophilum DSM 16684]
MLINITGGHDMTLFEFDEAANKIREMVDEDANIIVGSSLDPEMTGRMRVSVVATGIDAGQSRGEVPLPRRSMSAPLREKVSIEEPQVPAARTAATARPAVQPAATQPASRPAPQPAAPRPAAQPAAPVAASAMSARAVESAPAERTFDARAPQPVHHDVGDFSDIESALQEDALPPPAYQPPPQPQTAAPMAVASQPAPQAGARPPAGTPTPEAIARLRAMASRAAEARGNDVPRPAPAAPQSQPQTEKRGFGINSLINRMTGGHASDSPAAARAPARAPYESPAESEQERADIPAFLRRQAN